MIEARSGGSLHHQEFARGETIAAATLTGAFASDGLTVRFRPDPQIFGDAKFDAARIRDRLRQLAFLYSGVRITFTDETNGTHDEFEYADGIRECVQALNADRTPIHADVIVLRGEEDGIRYEVGLQWCKDYELRQSFANHYRTPQGGTHERGLTAGVSLGLRDFMCANGPLLGEFKSEDFRDGLTAVVSVWLEEPMFESGAW